MACLIFSVFFLLVILNSQISLFIDVSRYLGAPHQYVQGLFICLFHFFASGFVVFFIPTIIKLSVSLRRVKKDVRFLPQMFHFINLFYSNF